MFLRWGWRGGAEVVEDDDAVVVDVDRVHEGAEEVGAVSRVGGISGAEMTKPRLDLGAVEADGGGEAEGRQLLLDGGLLLFECLHAVVDALMGDGRGGDQSVNQLIQIVLDAGGLMGEIIHSAGIKLFVVGVGDGGGDDGQVVRVEDIGQGLIDNIVLQLFLALGRFGAGAGCAPAR